MKRIRYIIALLFCLASSPIFAQYDSAEQILHRANTEYETGHFEEAVRLLESNIQLFDKAECVTVYRLMALCMLNEDKYEEAVNMTNKLLSINPYYVAYQDNPRFVDIINELKKGYASNITTASQQSESIEEAPVPVTVITEEMLRNIGARTIKDAIIAYVPGMTDLASNEESNIAMRGIYSKWQEKILFLINGYRMNSYMTNSFNPDYAMSLEKVKRIEVLRGPASSVYGGVALTAVVNVITKDGADIDGIKVKATAGNYGQFQMDFLIGNRYMGFNYTAWANVFSSAGQKIRLSPQEQVGVPGLLFKLYENSDIYINRYKKPVIDLGFNISWNDFSLLYNYTYSNRTPTYTTSLLFSPYDVKKYGKLNGSGPGNAVTSNYLALSYGHSWDKWTISSSLIINNKKSQQYQVLGDTVPDIDAYTFLITPNGTSDSLYMTKGAFRNISYEELSISGKIQAGYAYSFANHKGNLLFGGEFTHFNVDDWSYIEGDHFNRVLKNYNEGKVLYANHENSVDAYVQWKHVWNNEFVLNAGLRYDYKRKSTIIDVAPIVTGKKSLNELSPRFAFIWMHPRWNMKLSYAKSFVDAPYLYRNNNLDADYGLFLDPEYLHAVQFTVDAKVSDGLTLEGNVFYNKTEGLIYKAKVAEIFVNGGDFKMIGCELVGKYNHKSLSVTANMTWQHMLDSEFIGIIDGYIYNIPSWLANIVCAYRVTPRLNIHAKANYASKVKTDNSVTQDVIDIPARVIIGIGADYSYKDMGLSLNIHNLLNQNYQAGGNVTAPIRQQGISILGSVSYKF